MGRCKRRTKQIVGLIARELSPVGVKLIGDIVGIVEGTDWTGEQKRKGALTLVKAAFKQRSIEAGENAIRAGIEASVAALKQGQDALAEMGEVEDIDLISEEPLP